MSLGYIIRFTRRNQIGAWSFIFETLVNYIPPLLLFIQWLMLVLV